MFLQASQLTKSYVRDQEKLTVLNGIDLEVQKGEDLCIVGASGAGKSTLLHILGTIDKPSSGELYFQNTAIHNLKEEELAELRNKKIGFVFQFHHLLPEFSALENVMLPGIIANENKKQTKLRAKSLLDMVGLSSRIHHYPSELSGGEQQRVAIARALYASPELLLADEPTGNLDSTNSEMVQQLFFDLHRDLGVTLITVTHDQRFAAKFSRCLQIIDGRWS